MRAEGTKLRQSERSPKSIIEEIIGASEGSIARWLVDVELERSQATATHLTDKRQPVPEELAAKIAELKNLTEKGEIALTDLDKKLFHDLNAISIKNLIKEQYSIISTVQDQLIKYWLIAKTLEQKNS